MSEAAAPGPVVAGHVLPERLAEMLATGRWGRAGRQAPGLDLRALPIEDQDDLVFLGLPEIIANTRELKAAYERGEGMLLGLVRNDPAPLPDRLDVDRAVLIAVTYGQEALALDYSRPGPPRVVATASSSHSPPGVGAWVEVAPTFEELLALVGLSPDSP
jgi:hypothetical protein